MSRHYSFQPSRARGCERPEIAFFFARRLVEAQNENLQLRLELQRSRTQLKTLRTRLEACLRQIQGLVASIREIVLLRRMTHATEATENFRLLHLGDIDDNATETTSNSARSTVSLIPTEDWVDLEEAAESLHQPSHVGRY
ncbi:hypothetical protein PHYPSEUDO_003136 [Phytophthora pseudosyringae]|uniref:Uncharacterized protein n=1 Tax=Phytophthora pseudosyringae TaxID=221518 RepID=A0A8T1WIN8_9STRA|nr:hypothetical protein PHYPSEUDO_003136 [Phytophthora pseudosyringae]